MANDVKGKVIVVTGSADGLGLGIVDYFLKNGAKLAIILDINEEKGQQSVKNLTGKYGKDRVLFFPCNVITDLENIFAEITQITNVDVLVNNAGILDEHNIKKTMNINAIAMMEWTMKFLDFMRKDKDGNGGTIINVTSIFSLQISPFFPYYHASKFAVRGFSQSIGHKYNFNRTGVRVITLCPGLTKTNLASNASVRDEDVKADMEAAINNIVWQEVDNVGRGIIDVFEKAESGTVWLIDSGRPAEEVNSQQI